MKLAQIHINEKVVSAKAIATYTKSSVTAIQILKGGLLKEHSTPTPALLVCVLGEVVYQDETQNKVTLTPGDYYEIEPTVKHWLKGVANSQLLLIK